MRPEEHLTVDQIVLNVFESEPLSGEAAEHLMGCVACRQKMAEYEALRNELGIAAHSVPPVEALQAYAALYKHVQASRPSMIERAWSWVTATLLMDSREGLQQAGVRNLSLRQYRLLFAAPSADIELLIAPEGRARRIEGDVLAADDDAFGLPALVQLLPLTASAAPAETETDDQGRFQLGGVAVGAYVLMVTPARGETIQVELMDIT